MRRDGVLSVGSSSQMVCISLERILRGKETKDYSEGKIKVLA